MREAAYPDPGPAYATPSRAQEACEARYDAACAESLRHARTAADALATALPALEALSESLALDDDYDCWTRDIVDELNRLIAAGGDIDERRRLDDWAMRNRRLAAEREVAACRG